MFGLQSPVVGRARLAVRLRDVDLGNPRVPLHHLQRAVPQQRLQGKDVATGSQIGDRIGWKGGALHLYRCTFPPSPLQTGQATWRCIRLSSTALLGTGVMGCVAGSAQQLSSLLQAGLRHVTHASLDPFRFD